MSHFNAPRKSTPTVSRLEDLTQAQKDQIIRSWMDTTAMLGMSGPVIDLTVDPSEYDPHWSDEIDQPHFGCIGERADLSASQFLPGPTTVNNTFDSFVSLPIDQQVDALEGFELPSVLDNETQEQFDARVEQELLARVPTVNKLERSEEVLPLYRTSSSQDTESIDGDYDPMEVDSWTFSSDEGYESSSSSSIFIEY